MQTFLMSAYVLMWPVVVAGVLFFIARGFLREWKEAREKGVPMV
ncbi:MAG TPA: putative transporter small subunit [Pedomonas sp.]|nr:putative transporter small subunit [Pedomonas sp.]